MPFKGMSNNKGFKGKGKPYNKGKAQTQGCYRCGQQGHIAKDCRVGVYHLNEANNTNTNNDAYHDAMDQWYQQQPNYDAHWWNSEQTMTSALPQPQQQLALPAPPQYQQDMTPILHIGAIRAAPQLNYNKEVPNIQQVPEEEDLMIDSGAATHVCPVWFAAQQPTYNLHPTQTPQLRTATEDAINVYGYKWVYMKTEQQQPMVIPFYVCDVSQPILSVTRLAEQGFNITLSEHPTVTNNNGFEATLKKKDGLYCLPVKTTTSRIQKLDVHQTPDGIKATVSPVTLTPEGAQWVTHNNDVWMYNNQGYLARLHRSQRRALYTPDQQCPVPEDKLENYRRTIAHKADGTTEDFVEQCTDLGKQMIRKRLPGPTWSGETWFRVKQDVKPPPPPLPKVTPKKHELQRQATPKQKALQQAPEQPRQQQQGRQQPEAPLRRHTTKSPQSILPQPQHFPATSVPKPHEVAPTGDYWIKEGHLWKRVHNTPRTNLYVPQQTHDGPDVSQLLPTRQAIVKPTSGARGYRIDDGWTTKTFAKLNQAWIGSTNFEVGQTYKDEYFEEQEEEQQPAAKATGLKTPDQPTPQERAEHELTHLPFRSWCPTCVQSKGRSDNHPKQQSRSPVVQFDFCFFKALGENINTNPHRYGCSNRHVHGSSGDQQASRLSTQHANHTSIPSGMWQSTSSTQQHRATNRSRRPSHSTPSRSSQQIWRQHQRQTGASIQLAITGQCRTVPQNTDGTSESTQIATPTRLRHHHTLSTSSHAMGQTCGLPTQQVRHSLRRQHKLLQTFEQIQQTTTV